MPCTDGGPTYPVPFDDVEAMLCAVMTSLEAGRNTTHVLNDVNWKEAGVTKDQLLSWWKRHKDQDRKRRVAEAEEQARKAARKLALAKLTPYERKALGL